MKIISFLIVFIFAGLLYISTVNVSLAGTIGQCVDYCHSECDSGPNKTDCRDLQGESRRVCNIIQNKFSECCFQECLEDECEIVGSEDVICDLLESECGGGDL